MAALDRPSRPDRRLAVRTTWMVVLDLPSGPGRRSAARTTCFVVLALEVCVEDAPILRLPSALPSLAVPSLSGWPGAGQGSRDPMIGAATAAICSCCLLAAAPVPCMHPTRQGHGGGHASLVLRVPWSRFFSLEQSKLCTDCDPLKTGERQSMSYLVISSPNLMTRNQRETVSCF